MRQITSVMNVPQILNLQDTFQSIVGKQYVWSVIFICKFIIIQSQNHMTVTGEKKKLFKSRRRRRKRRREKRRRKRRREKRRKREVKNKVRGKQRKKEKRSGRET